MIPLERNPPISLPGRPKFHPATGNSICHVLPIPRSCNLVKLLLEVQVILARCHQKIIASYLTHEIVTQFASLPPSQYFFLAKVDTYLAELVLHFLDSPDFWGIDCGSIRLSFFFSEFFFVLVLKENSDEYN